MVLKGESYKPVHLSWQSDGFLFLDSPLHIDDPFHVCPDVSSRIFSIHSGSLLHNLSRPNRTFPRLSRIPTPWDCHIVPPHCTPFHHHPGRPLLAAQSPESRRAFSSTWARRVSQVLHDGPYAVVIKRSMCPGTVRRHALRLGDHVRDRVAAVVLNERL